MYYPPGGILMWIIIYLELITFGMALIAMVYYGKQEASSFHNSRMLLDTNFGAINTLILISSGFFMVRTVQAVKSFHRKKAKKFLLFTMLLGCLFLVLKTFEYQAKLQAGYVIDHNTFFTFYWLLTLFHVVHVIVGIVILGFMYAGLRNEKKEVNVSDVESSAAFWHMCDLIWILLFPIIYLVF